MIGISEKNNKSFGKVITMDKMQPLEFGVIIETKHPQIIGHIVMRTASSSKFEVMDLTNPGNGKCWTGGTTSPKIKIFVPKNIKIELTLHNE